MNEKRIREVIEVEKRALDLLEQAKREAEGAPLEAETQARALIENGRAAARKEAQQLLDGAESGEDAAEILAQAEARMRTQEQLAQQNLDRAVAYVLERVVGGS